MTFVMDNFNSRMGNLKDYVEEVNMIDTRCCIDEINSHGSAFIDFLLERKLAVLNGRVCLLEDNYMCISVKGRSIVDYAATVHENLKNVTKFSLVLTSDMVARLNLQDMCEHRISDHSLLPFEFIFSAEQLSDEVNEEVHNPSPSQCSSS